MTDSFRVEKGNGARQLAAHLVPFRGIQGILGLGRGELRPKEREDKTAMVAVGTGYCE
jgi:hypothetical protein